MLARLLARLKPQLVPGVTALTLTDAGDSPIGAKRQTLLESATAEWVSFVDDDDLVSGDYVARGLTAMDRGVDVIGFRLRYWDDGALCGHAVHSYRAVEIPMPPDAPRECKRQERLPNHLNPVRRELALRVGYKPLNFGEDADYARRLAALGPREAFVDAVMYEYLFRRSRAGEVTNETRAGRPWGG